MSRTNLYSLVHATGGRLSGLGCLEATIGQVRVDSRLVQPGDVFWALPGSRSDGHQFVPEALARGALCCVVEQGRVPAIGPLLSVPDPLRALADFAAAVRRQAEAMVIGVTGSNGKTTTRAMLHAVLATRFAGIQSPANYNNHVGVPLSLLELDARHEFAAIEIAASHIGEIASLAAIAQPEAAVVTSIAPAHLADFGSLENIIQAKGELVEAVPAGGFVVLNGDDPHVRSLANRASCRVVFAGEQPGNDVRIERVQIQNDRIDLIVNGFPFSVRAIGRHHALAAALCIATGREIGLSDREIALGLARFEAVPGRCCRLDIGDWTVIDDSYNANPGSMHAACEVLRHWQSANHKWLVLGDMLSLGPQSAEFHRQLGRQIAASGLDGLAVVGEFASHVVDAAVAHGMDRGCLGAFQNASTLIEMLECWLEPGDTVLVKGSRGMRMEQVIEGLRQISERSTRVLEPRRAA